MFFFFAVPTRSFVSLRGPRLFGLKRHQSRREVSPGPWDSEKSSDACVKWSTWLQKKRFMGTRDWFCFSVAGHRTVVRNQGRKRCGGSLIRRRRVHLLYTTNAHARGAHGARELSLKVVRRLKAGAGRQGIRAQQLALPARSLSLEKGVVWS